MRRPPNAQIYSSTCGDTTIRGNISQLIAKHDALAEEAERAEDTGLAHSHRQHADHYRRIQKGEK